MTGSAKQSRARKQGWIASFASLLAMTKLQELSRLLEQFPADQHASNLAGAGADLVELGVAQQPPGRIVVDIAVAAEQLDGVERALRRLLGGIENGACRILARGLAAIAGLGHRV